MIDERFSAAAKTYDRHAHPQLSLAQSVVSFLPETYPEQILELGTGTGAINAPADRTLSANRLDYR